MQVGDVHPVTLVLPVEHDGSTGCEDLLVLAASFEDRCLGVIDLLSSQLSPYCARRVVLVHYDSDGDHAVDTAVQRNYQRLRLAAGRLLAAGGSLTEIELRAHSIMVARTMIDDLVHQLPPGASVTVDVSTMTKPHVMYWPDQLTRGGARSVRLLYTRTSYALREPMSWGAKEPVILPGFGEAPILAGFGEAPQSQADTAMVMFCGLEANRSYAAFKRYASTRGWLVYVRPDGGDLDGIVRRAESYHRFAEDAGWKRLEVATAAPGEVADLLSGVMEQCNRIGAHLLISPLTTKWEVLGTWLFFGRNPTCEASVIYTPPGRYNCDAYRRRPWGGVLEMLVSG